MVLEVFELTPEEQLRRQTSGLSAKDITDLAPGGTVADTTVITSSEEEEKKKATIAPSPVFQPGGELRSQQVGEAVALNLQPTALALDDPRRQAATTLATEADAPGQIIDATRADLQVGAAAPITAATGVTTEAAQPLPIDAAQVDAAETASAAAEAAQGRVSDAAQVEAAQGGITNIAQAAVDEALLMDEATAEAALGDLPANTLVTSQLNQLLAGLETGEIPAFAQPALDAVNAQLAARGLSASSVGRAALTNAIIQSAIPLAQSNAQALQTNFAQNKSNQQQVNLANAAAAQGIQVQNLNNRQQTAMLNAQNLAQMDLTNLSNAQQAQVANAQAFLQMDLSNLNNEQQSNVLNAQMKQQSLLSNQSSENAARQFNATSQNQTDQFMTNLKASIDTNNASRADAMSNFNAGQENAMTQFASSEAFQREQFNAQNATAIEQSNTQWRRQANTINTAAENAVNQANAMNSFNLSNQALTFMWQEMRDAAKWSFESAENNKQRAAALAQAALGADAISNANTLKNITAIGAATANIMGDLFGEED